MATMSINNLTVLCISVFSTRLFSALRSMHGYPTTLSATTAMMALNELYSTAGVPVG
jgi:hypothetical protein